jgi:hypothetical protein
MKILSEYLSKNSNHETLRFYVGVSVFLWLGHKSRILNTLFNTLVFLLLSAAAAPKSRLGDVFKSESVPPTGNQTLTYERPKQPNPSTPKGPIS